MSKKRRVFDIQMPEGDAPVPAGTPAPETKSVGRRGPMATAIGETADSLRERRAREAEIRDENDRLAHEYVRLKQDGLIVDQIPLGEIRIDKLTRDRHAGPDPELEELKQSIREIGLSNPIQVEQVEGGYELIQGFRRLSAFRALHEETGEERFARIPAGLVAHGEALEGLYRRMVDENMVRKDISFAEMAGLARAYAEDPETAAADVEEAVAILFRSAGRQKRSYIRHFATLLERLEKHLNFPQAIPRALGLSVVKRLEQDPASVTEVVRMLRAGVSSGAEEVAVLRRFADGQGEVSPRGQADRTRAAKTTFRLSRPQGEAKCTAADGRLELRLNRDFTAIDRYEMEAAIKAFLDRLDG